ncbi:MAG: membrane protein insertase YidC [Phycisphaeraceae bacterium]|nr:MAG: membrane protein insertase YidC [Phycisphaeraceae bacterium]
MPREKNKTLRLLVPLIVGLAAFGVVVSVYVQTMRPTSPPPAAERPAEQAPTETTAPEPREEIEPERPIAASPASPATPVSPETDPDQPGVVPGEDDPLVAGVDEPSPTDPRGLRVRPVAVAAEDPAPIGDTDPDSGHNVRVAFTPFGAGVEAITLTHHFQSIRREENYRVQERKIVEIRGRRYAAASLACLGVEIDGEFIDLFSDVSEGAPRPVWSEVGPGEFEAMIVDRDDAPVARVVKRYSVTPGSYAIRLEQTLENLTDRALEAQWYQYGPVDMPVGEVGYGGDKRRIRFGFLHDQRSDPSRQIVDTDNKLRTRDSVISSAERDPNRWERLWPTEDTIERGRELVWTSLTNRYFAFAVHPLVDEASFAAGQHVDRRFTQAQEVYGVVLGFGPERVLALQFNSPVNTVEAGQTLDLSLGAYAGPLGRRQLAAERSLEAVRLDLLVLYNFGGPCAFCTFQPLARGLMIFLGFMHDYLLRDWALAIMLLVVCVRGALHPVTRKSQIGMMRFAKQMQAIAPKQQKLREKFKDDPKRMQQEMIKLYREENVKFSGMFGCLPLFLQSPIWIALFAMLYFAFELRHEAAFFGVFQAVSAGHWIFLADLSAPDRFIYFGRALFTIPLFGPIESLNVLPLLLGLVFYIQQKYLTPPPTTALSPEQAQQQKIMKFMMVVMFPVIMYNAPSGLALYFITNSALGIAESRYIRAHVDKMDLEPPKPKKPAPAGPGPGRKQVSNTAPKNPFRKKREREGSPYKGRDRKKK